MKILKLLARIGFTVGLIAFAVGMLWQGKCFEGDCQSDWLVFWGLILSIASLITWIVIRLITGPNPKNPAA